MNINAEWDALLDNLSAREAQDGRRCFYAGVLAVVKTYKDFLPRMAVREMRYQIAEALNYDEPGGTK